MRDIIWILQDAHVCRCSDIAYNIIDGNRNWTSMSYASNDALNMWEGTGFHSLKVETGLKKGALYPNGNYCSFQQERKQVQPFTQETFFPSAQFARAPVEAKTLRSTSTAIQASPYYEELMPRGWGGSRVDIGGWSSSFSGNQEAGTAKRKAVDEDGGLDLNLSLSTNPRGKGITKRKLWENDEEDQVVLSLSSCSSSSPRNITTVITGQYFTVDLNSRPPDLS